MSNIRSVLAGVEEDDGESLTGTSTVLHWTDFRFGTNLDESEFTQTALRRVR